MISRYLLDNLVVDCPGRVKRKKKLRRSWLQISRQGSKEFTKNVHSFFQSVGDFFVEVISAETHNARAINPDEECDS